MISVEQHLERILHTVSRLASSRRGLLDAQGCVLADDVTSLVELPGFDNSAMDGYAVYAADTQGAAPGAPVSLDVVGDIAAGDTRHLTLPPGRAYRIMTGAPVPDGCDGIVPVEDTDGGTDVVSIAAPAVAGKHIRRAGEDVLAGQVVLRAGELLGPRQLALLASVGHGDAVVTPQPRVVVVSTGDELVAPGVVPGHGQVVDSNSLMLTAAIRDAGAVPYLVRGVKDDVDVFLETMESQLVRADAIVTSGGVSMGAFDVVKEALTRLGTVDFVRVAMQPGKPQGFGTLGPGRVPIFALPGNPVSALVSFEVFVAPALRVMAGRPARGEQPIRAVSTEDWSSAAGRTQFARVRLARTPTRYTFRLCGGQGSHILGGLSESNAFAVVPADVTHVAAGDVLNCLPVGPVDMIADEDAPEGR